MNRLVANVIVAIVFFAAGWFASREYMLHQMLAVFAPSAAQAVVATAMQNIGEVKEEKPKAREALAKIQVTDPRYTPAKDGLMVTAELIVHIKNNTDRTLSSVAIKYELVSPGRKVPWISEDRAYTSISGGLAPGEEKDESFVGVSIYSLGNWMKQHPEAQLSVSVVDARDEKNTAI